MLIDSHCHLNFNDFAEDFSSVLARARLAKIEKMLTVNTCLSETLALQAIADEHADIFCTVGVHPHESDKYNDVDLYGMIKNHTAHQKTVGIGETGLDYHYNHSEHLSQIRSFEQHLQVAIDTKLPVIIHTRNADVDTINVLKNFSGVTGVFHCFSGSAELAAQALAMGFFLSFSGIITFKKAEEIREVVKDAPLEKILIETDSPYLSPIPYRGKRNEPSYVALVAEQIATIKSLSLTDIAKITTENFYTLFTKVSKQF